MIPPIPSVSSILGEIRDSYRAFRLRRRRRRLLVATAEVERIRMQKPGYHSLTPMVGAYAHIDREGLLDLDEDGTVEWHWPADGGGES